MLLLLLFFMLCQPATTTFSTFQFPLMKGCCKFRHSPKELLTCALGVSDILLERDREMQKFDHRSLNLGLYCPLHQFILANTVNHTLVLFIFCVQFECLGIVTYASLDISTYAAYSLAINMAYCEYQNCSE